MINSNGTVTGPFSKGTYHSATFDGIVSPAYDLNFDASSVTDMNGDKPYIDNGEARPENMTYKLWKRIA